MSDTQNKVLPDDSMPEPVDKDLYADVTVTEQEKEDFVKCFLADKPLVLSFSIMMNKLQFKLRSLQVQEHQDILYLLELERRKEALTTQELYYTRLMNYRLAVSLLEMNDAAFMPGIDRISKPVVAGKPDNYLTERVAVLETWPTFKIVAMQNTFKDFELKLMKLTAAVINPDFWKAGA